MRWRQWCYRKVISKTNDLKANEIKKKKQVQVQKIRWRVFFGEAGKNERSGRKEEKKRDGQNKGDGQKRDQEKKRKTKIWIDTENKRDTEEKEIEKDER